MCFVRCISVLVCILSVSKCGAMALRHGDSTASIDIPVLLELREDLSLGMVADDSRVYETT